MGAVDGRRLTPRPKPGMFVVPLDVLRRLDFPDGYHGCWIWTGALKYGYPRYHRNVMQMIMRTNGKVWHCVMDKRCVNPEHLEVQ